MNTDNKQTKVSGDQNVRRKIVVEYDHEPDFSWLDQPEFKNENKDDHIALEMTVYEMGENDWKLVESLGNIDFRKDGDDWAVGTFYRVSELPVGYLRHLATEAGLPNEDAGKERALAVEFVERLKACLTEDELVEIRKRNATPAYSGNVCASHDFIDANMVMNDAFEKVTGREIDCENGADCVLWSKAWDIAKVEFLTEGNAPNETIQEREYKRLYLKASSQRDELIAKVRDLQRAWIAPHKFNLKAAELALVALADSYKK